MKIENKSFEDLTEEEYFGILECAREIWNDERIFTREDKEDFEWIEDQAEIENYFAEVLEDVDFYKNAL